MNEVPTDDSQNWSAAESETTSSPGGGQSADPVMDSSVVKTLQAELAEAQDRAVRIAAELDNFRKRTRREMEEALRYAQLPVLRDLLPVVDNLKRALEAADLEGAQNSLVVGVRMVASQLEQVLKGNHCEPIPAVGEPFDPNHHEALRMEPSDEHAANVVSRELQTGYRMHDRVIRPAQVFVSTGPAAAGG